MSPARKRERIAVSAPFRRIASRSSRATRAPGHSRRTSASTRSVPNPACSRYGAGTVRARRRHPHRVVAVVAARAPRRPLAVHDQRHAAVGTVHRAGALPAEHRRGESAPVQQDERLLAPFEPRGERGFQRAAEDDVGAAFRVFLAHVDDRHRRQADDRARASRGRRARTVRSSRCSSSPSTASPNRARRARRRAGRGRSRRRDR